jgi:arylsulfatase
LGWRANATIVHRPNGVESSGQIRDQKLSLKNKPHSVTAEIEVPEGGADGATVVQGRITGGWGLYLHTGAERRTATTSSASSTTSSVATHHSNPAPIRYGWSSTTTVAASARERPSRSTWTALRSDRAASSSPRATCSAPRRPATYASSTSPDYTPETSRFTGTVNWVELAIDEAASADDHYLSPDERFRVAMAIQ